MSARSRVAAVIAEPDAVKAATLTPGGEDMLRFSFPIEKTEDTADGDLVVYGKATDGTLDSDLQIVDPDWSAKALKEWFDTGANVRVQHQARRDPAGKGLDVTYTPDGHYLKALVVEPVAKKLVRKGVLQDFSVGLMNVDVRVADPKFKHLPGWEKAIGGVVTGRRDGLSKIGEVSLCDRGANFGTRFAMVKAAADGTPEWVGEMVGEIPGEVTKDAKPKTVDVTLPKNMSLTIKPSDLAKLATFRQELAKQEAETKTTAEVTKAAEPDPAGEQLLRDIFTEPEPELDEVTKAAETAIYKRDIDTATRRRLHSEGRALSNLSYPIETHEDAGNAVTLALSGHGDVSAAKKLIKRVARKEGWTDILDRLKGKKKGKVADPEAGKKKGKLRAVCPGCGAKQNPEHAHCPECGGKLPMRALVVAKNHDFVCLHCGKNLDKGEKFCPSCGHENPGHNPMADQKIPANKTAKPKKPKKGKKGKPFGGSQAPPFGEKDGDGDDDADDKASKKAARVTKGKKKGRKPTPGSASGAVGEGSEMPVPEHREPDGAAMEAFEADAGMEDGDGGDTGQPGIDIGHSDKAADPEMAAAMHLNALGVPTDAGSLHALTCPAYDLDDVAKAFPRAAFAGIDLGQWQMADLEKAAFGPLEEAAQLLAIGGAAKTLKTTDPHLLADLRAEAHKAFRDANPGPSSFPTPGELSPARYNRPYISEGHAAASPGHDAPRSVKLPPAGGIEAGRFTRDYITDGRAAESPDNQHTPGPLNTPSPTGAPTGLPGRQYETNFTRNGAQHAISAMHDHISRIFPDICPMEHNLGDYSHPVPSPTGGTKPAPGARKAAKAAARKAKRKAAKAKAKAAKVQAAKRRKMERQVLAGKVTVEKARAKLDMKPLAIAKGMQDFQVRGEAVRQSYGIDGTAGDAQDVEHPFTPDAVGNPATCVACGLTKTAKPHATTGDPDAFAAAIKPLVKRLRRQDKALAAQGKALRKVRRTADAIAAQPDTTAAPFRGTALTKTSAPAVQAPIGFAEQAQMNKVHLLQQEMYANPDPGLREAARAELNTLLGTTTMHPQTTIPMRQ